MKNLLIRAEDKNIWERRTPLIPADIQTLIKNTGCEIYVEKSDKRFFTEADYIKAGAKITSDMKAGEVIFGVKEIPVNKILDNKVYAFFSHTIKRQNENMPMLKKIIDSNSTLIDYEKIADSRNRRQLYFGNYAGDVGTIDILWLMGEYWENKGIKTPFTECKQALNYFSVEEAKQHLKQIGDRIKKDGLPAVLNPLVIAVLGYGNVSQGVQAILSCLPVIEVEPSELKSICEDKNISLNEIYMAVFKEKDLVKTNSGEPFNLLEYYNEPEKYISDFSRYLPYISIIINATFWEQCYPKFVTWKGLEELYKIQPKMKLQGIADITCDVNGSIECNVKTTDSGMPAYLIDPITKRTHNGHKGAGIVLLAVDNLPAELPNDASTFFSGHLKKYVANILKADYYSSLDQSGLHPDIKKAVIVYNGELTPDYKYLEESLYL